MREFVSPESFIEFGELVRHKQRKTIKPIFELAGHQVYNGDARAILPHIKVPNITPFSDPCWGTGTRNRNQETIPNDDKNFDITEYLIPVLRITPYGKRVTIFFPKETDDSILTKLPISPPETFTWKKDKHTASKNNFVLRNTETIFTFLNGKDCKDKSGRHIMECLEYDTPPGGKGRFHRIAQKPIALMRYIISKVSEPGDTILDFMAGSGTIAVAAHLEGRKSISIELLSEYSDIIVRRLEHVIATGEAIDDKRILEAYEGLTLSDSTCVNPNCETCKTNRRRNAIRIK